MRIHHCLVALVAWLTWAPVAAAEPLSGNPAGRLIDIGSHSLYLRCIGTGTPAVLFESGIGGVSMEWLRLQRQIGQFTMACSYDRAGYGLSEASPQPRTARAIVDELHRLRRNARIPLPIIIVAHSFGGYAAQLYARTYPQELAGVILVDASHPDQTRTFKMRKYAFCSQVDDGYAYLQVSIAPRAPAGLSPANQRIALALMRRPAAIRAQLSELCHFSESARQVRDAPPFPDLPLVVISRGRTAFPPTPRGRFLERAWRGYQADLAGLVAGGVHVVARRSGHTIHLDQPGVIAEFARASVQLSRFDIDDIEKIAFAVAQ
jgi:pimeloyl-ACP methyl ester carboxylesterase